MKKLVVLAVLSCSCWWPATAFATGGSSIASAPTVMFGQQEFGNTATDAPFYNYFSNSWSLLPVIAGDRVTLDLQSQFVNCTTCITNGPKPDVSEVVVYPVGTNDYNYTSANPVDQQSPSTNGDLQAVVTPSSTGEMPLDINAYEGNAGPYSFTAYVQHALVLGQSHSSNRRRHRTHFAVAVHDPDGVAITNSALRMTVVVGTRSLKIAPPFAFNVGWTRRQQGKWQTVRMTVSGPSYRTSSITVRVKAL